MGRIAGSAISGILESGYFGISAFFGNWRIRNHTARLKEEGYTTTRPHCTGRDAQVARRERIGPERRVSWTPKTTQRGGGSARERQYRHGPELGRSPGGVPQTRVVRLANWMPMAAAAEVSQRQWRLTGSQEIAFLAFLLWSAFTRGLWHRG